MPEFFVLSGVVVLMALAVALVLAYLAFLRKAVTLRWVYIYRLPQVLKDEAVRDIGFALAAGALKPHIGARYRLDQVAEAHDHLDSGKLIGKAVVTMDS